MVNIYFWIVVTTLQISFTIHHTFQGDVFGVAFSGVFAVLTGLIAYNEYNGESK